MTNKISIIVPVYNKEKYIERCITSILKQTYSNIEIIIVNDGSTDNSLKKCKKLQEIDSRIVIINQNNKGVSVARNTGLDVVTGDYIAFIDPDDTIDENYLLELINATTLLKFDLVVSKINCIIDDSNFYPYNPKNGYPIYFQEDFIKLFLNFKVGSAVWGKLFSKNAIGDIRFKKLNINEDFIFIWEVIKKSKLFSETPDTCYNYYLNTEQSLSKAKFNEENMSMMEHIDTVINDVKKMYPKLTNDAKNYYGACLLHNLVLYYNYLNSTDCKKLYLNEKDEMIKRVREIDRINNYFLTTEQNIDIKRLVKQIENEIAKKECI